MSMEIIGLDLSLTATGYADHRGTRILASKARGMVRLDELERRVLIEIDERQSREVLVVTEGYSFGQGRGIQNHALGELGGVVRLALYRAGFPYVDVPPASLKRFATGKGNANKDEVLASAIRKWGFEGSNNNEADAWILRQMGLVWSGQVDAPAYAREALMKIEWPKEVVGAQG